MAGGGGFCSGYNRGCNSPLCSLFEHAAPRRKVYETRASASRSGNDRNKIGQWDISVHVPLADTDRWIVRTFSRSNPRSEGRGFRGIPERTKVGHLAVPGSRASFLLLRRLAFGGKRAPSEDERLFRVTNSN